VGINAEQIVVPEGESNEVVAAVRRYLTALEFTEDSSPPVKSIVTAPEFPKRHRRHCYLAEYEDGTICVVEIGGLAEREMAQQISVDTGEAAWLALHESINAWGLVVFLSGDIKTSDLNPPSAFESGVKGPPYEGDATAEAMDHAAQLGDFEIALTYTSLANGERPDGLIRATHLAFSRR
jgi:hypothetical protein